MGLKFPSLKKSNDGEDEFPDADQDVVEETLVNASDTKRSKGDDDAINYGLVVDWGRKYKPSMTFASRSIVEDRDTKAAKKLMKKVVVLTAAIMAVVSILAFGASIFVKGGLDKELEAGKDNASTIASLQPIANYFDEFVKSQDAAKGVLTKDVTWSKIQDNIKAALPEGAKITNESTRYGEVCATPTPFAQSSTIGCIQLDVTVNSYGDLGKLIDNLSDGKSKGISDPYVTTTTNSAENGVTASLTFNFDQTVISQKYNEFTEGAKTDPAATPTTAPVAP